MPHWPGAKGLWEPKSNSQSSKAEQLADYRATVLDHEAQARTDRTHDPGIWWKPVPWDPRFPNINQAKHCFVMYKDFFKCQKLRGPDYEPCQYFKNVYTSICPSLWTEEWDDQRANGCWFGNLMEEED